ncbi:4Fe-4S dicluster domain-containing protein [Raoultibacter phocaeensis]|uniref:4Fe-4S dicluster domain-containing protein n=1 Tax=Raoultibacter phocaeensis TaxID=2479841 RepID=UPI002104114C|nr:4Fe-4S dicluster domain-containing protein [Raoultibacter phocaeensis]
MTVVETKSVSAAVMCHQCESAPCLAVCPTGVITRVNGIVRVDEQRCIGCKMCSIACPYGAVQPSGTSVAGVAGVCYRTPTHPGSVSPLLAWEIGVAACAVKCDLCSGLSTAPRCVETCPTGALTLIDQEKVDADLREKRHRTAGELEAMSVEVSKVRRSQWV